MKSEASPNPGPEAKPQEAPKLKTRDPSVLEKHFELPDGTLAPKFTAMFIYLVDGGYRVHYQQGSVAKFNAYTDENLPHINFLLAESEAAMIKEQADKDAAKAR